MSKSVATERRTDGSGQIGSAQTKEILMRYLTMVKLDESMPFGPPPPELFEAIEKIGDEARKDGSMILEGGLYPTADGALVHLANDKISVVDGPFAEAKEVIGGFAMFEVRSHEEALERARVFLQAHADTWPGCEMTVEVRRMYEAGEGPDFS